MAKQVRVFTYTGAAQTFSVPDYVTSARFEVYGAAGAVATLWAGTGPTSGYVSNYTNATQPSAGLWYNAGGYAAGDLAVTSGDSYGVYVGGNGLTGGSGAAGAASAPGGAGGWNGGGAGGAGAAYYVNTYPRGGGGGGGATDIRHGGTALTDRILVAGGSGGAGGLGSAVAYSQAANPTSPTPPFGSGSSPSTGYAATYYRTSTRSSVGAGGGSTGGEGDPVVGPSGAYTGTGGGGGTQAAGGAGGPAFSSPEGVAGAAGALGVGGAGGNSSAAALHHEAVCGGGGGGGGYYGGGGGSSGWQINQAAGGGGGSNYLSGSFTGTLNYAHVLPPVHLGATGYGGLAVITYQQPPNPPTFTDPLDGEDVDSAADLPVALSFSSLVSGAVFTTFDIRYRVSPAGAWTTVSGVAVSGTMGTYTIPAADLTAGNNYDIEARVTDSEGDISNWSSITVVAITPPPAPVITAPTSPENSATFNVTWTQASGDTQGDYEVAFLDASGATVYASGVVASATQSHAVSWTAPSQDGLTLKVRYSTATDPGIWSPWASVAMEVNINPPGAPVVTGITDDILGTATFTITAGDTPNPTTTVDVYRQDVTHSEAEIRVAVGLVPDATTREVVWTDYTLANRTLYRFRFRANSAAGGFAFD